MIEVTVDRIAYDTQHQRAIVLLKHADSERYLPIIVGPLEAGAIAIAVEGIEPPRPQTHDLLKQILDRLNIKVAGVLIDDVRDETFFAQISLLDKDRVVEIDSRPSDAIALALRARVPISVLERVLDLAGVAADAGPIH
ncbi:MAG: bifunctional nuclease family protein [Bacillota bacterium]|nr:bifunctional nuclease family protein [Bacillota bacterium]